MRSALLLTYGPRGDHEPAIALTVALIATGKFDTVHLVLEKEFLSSVPNDPRIITHPLPSSFPSSSSSSYPSSSSSSSLSCRASRLASLNPFPIPLAPSASFLQPLDQMRMFNERQRAQLRFAIIPSLPMVHGIAITNQPSVIISTPRFHSVAVTIAEYLSIPAVLLQLLPTLPTSRFPHLLSSTAASILAARWIATSHSDCAAPLPHEDPQAESYYRYRKWMLQPSLSRLNELRSRLHLPQLRLDGSSNNNNNSSSSSGGGGGGTHCNSNFSAVGNVFNGGGNGNGYHMNSGNTGGNEANLSGGLSSHSFSSGSLGGMFGIRRRRQRHSTNGIGTGCSSTTSGSASTNSGPTTTNGHYHAPKPVIVNCYPIQLIPRIPELMACALHVPALSADYIPPGWSASTRCPRLCSFLTRQDSAGNVISGNRPWCIAFGEDVSIPKRRRRSISRAILGALRACGVRDVIITYGTDIVADDLSLMDWAHRHVYYCKKEEDVQFAWLFTKCRGVICHGGAGTIATALRVGVPVVSAPTSGDQFFWAYLIACSKLGAVATPDLLNANMQTFQKALNIAMSSAVRLNVERTGRMMRAQGSGARITANVVARVVSRV